MTTRTPHLHEVYESSQLREEYRYMKRPITGRVSCNWTALIAPVAAAVDRLLGGEKCIELLMLLTAVNVY